MKLLTHADVESTGRGLHLQRLPFHINQSGNEDAGALVTRAHQDENSSTCIDRFTETHRLIRVILNLRYPNTAVL